MNVDVCLTPEELTEETTKGKIVVVVDVLRACSTIVTALARGAREVLPVADMAEAGRLAAHLDTETALLGGERDGVRIEGYGVGNSPIEYEPELVSGKIVVLSTSNGTRTFTRVRSAAETVAGCLLNISRVVDFLDEVGKRPFVSGKEPEIVIICAGHDGRTALEDVLCAGMILHRLLEETEADLTDGALIAITQYRSIRQRFARSLFACEHTQRLIALGFGDDVAYCAQIDSHPVLPLYKDNLLILDRDDKERARSLTDSLAAGEEELA